MFSVPVDPGRVFIVVKEIQEITYRGSKVTFDLRDSVRCFSVVLKSH